MTLELQAKPEEVMRAVDALYAFCRERQIPEKTIFGIALALEECGSNIVNHALMQDPRQRFRVTIEQAADAVIVELRDPGPEFDPTRVASSAQEATGADEEPGGWGLGLVRRYTDEFSHSRESGENLVRLVKRFDPVAGHQ